MHIWPGTPYPLGSTYDGTGTNFAVFSEVAEKVELCLFDEAGKETRLALTEVDAFVWHGYLPGIEPGQRDILRRDGGCRARYFTMTFVLHPNATAIFALRLD